MVGLFLRQIRFQIKQTPSPEKSASRNVGPYPACPAELTRVTFFVFSLQLLEQGPAPDPVCKKNNQDQQQGDTGPGFLIENPGAGQNNAASQMHH